MPGGGAFGPRREGVEDCDTSELVGTTSGGGVESEVWEVSISSDPPLTSKGGNLEGGSGPGILAMMCPGTNEEDTAIDDKVDSSSIILYAIPVLTML